MLFTSGTTSKPKAVELTHNNLTSYITGTVEFASADPGDAALICVPPYHIAGVSAALSNLYAGPKDGVSDQLRRRASGYGWSAPRTSPRPPSCRRCSTASSACSTPPRPRCRRCARWPTAVRRSALPLVRKALALLPEVGFVNAYGLTETSSTIAVLTPDDHRAALASTDAAAAAPPRLGRPARARHRGADPRRRRHRARARRDRRALRPRRAGLGPLHRHRLGARRRGLVPHPRRRPARRRRLPVPRRPLRRHHHPRRREHRPRRDRGRPRRTSARARLRRRRAEDPEWGQIIVAVVSSRRRHRTRRRGSARARAQRNCGVRAPRTA